MIADDPFADFDTDQPVQNTSTTSGDQGGAAQQSGAHHGGGFAQEVYSEKISAKFRTFFIDLKQSSNGKFVKISEKSRGGQKSTIMFDAEDIDQMITALQNVKSRL